MDLPKIISVDDHVVEPAHVWETWLPAKYRDRGPKVVRRGIERIDMINPGNYKEVFNDDSPTKVDCWIYEDLEFTLKRHIAAAGYPVEEHTLTPVTYEDMRPGCFDPKARLEDMDQRLGRSVHVLPDVPPILRADLCGEARQGARPRVRQGLQRLDGRGVVRRLQRSTGAALPDPPVGRSRRRRGGPAQRRPGRFGRLLQRVARITSACPPSTPGTGIRSSRRVPTPARWSPCTSARRRRCP